MPHVIFTAIDRNSGRRSECTRCRVREREREESYCSRRTTAVNNLTRPYSVLDIGECYVHHCAKSSALYKRAFSACTVLHLAPANFSNYEVSKFRLKLRVHSQISSSFILPTRRLGGAKPRNNVWRTRISSRKSVAVSVELVDVWGGEFVEKFRRWAIKVCVVSPQPSHKLLLAWRTWREDTHLRIEALESYAYISVVKIWIYGREMRDYNDASTV